MFDTSETQDKEIKGFHVEPLSDANDSADDNAVANSDKMIHVDTQRSASNNEDGSSSYSYSGSESDSSSHEESLDDNDVTCAAETIVVEVEKTASLHLESESDSSSDEDSAGKQPDSRKVHSRTSTLTNRTRGSSFSTSQGLSPAKQRGSHGDSFSEGSHSHSSQLHSPIPQRPMKIPIISSPPKGSTSTPVQTQIAPSLPPLPDIPTPSPNSSAAEGSPSTEMHTLSSSFKKSRQGHSSTKLTPGSGSSQHKTPRSGRRSAPDFQPVSSGSPFDLYKYEGSGYDSGDEEDEGVIYGGSGYDSFGERDDLEAVPLLIPDARFYHISENQIREAGYDIDYLQRIRKLFYSSEKIYYPRRPILTILIGCLLALSAYLGLLPVGIAVWAGTTVMADDLIIYPLLRMIGFKRNLQHGRKKIKSILGFLITIAGYVLGALVGYFVLAHVPAFIYLVKMMVQSLHFLPAFTNCSIALWSGGSVAGAVFARSINIPTIFGLVIGSVAALFLPVAVPLVVDITITSALAFGFAFNYLSKHFMRMVFKLIYGHSNADGYFDAHAQEITQQDRDRSLELDMVDGVNEIASLRGVLIKAIDGVKAECHYGNEIMGTRRAITDSFKDILYLLMTASKPEDKARLRDLLILARDIAAPKEDGESKRYFDSHGIVAEALLKYKYQNLKRITNPNYRVHANYIPTEAERSELQDLEPVIANIHKCNDNFGTLFNHDYEQRNQYYHAKYKRGLVSGIAKCQHNKPYENIHAEIHQAIDSFLIRLPGIA